MLTGKTLRLGALAGGAACFLAAGQVVAAESAGPHLRTQGTATQLIAEGKLCRYR
jgi:hypothetical protein